MGEQADWQVEQQINGRRPSGGSNSHKSQIEHVYDELQSLSAETLVRIIDELKCGFAEGPYKNMQVDVYNKAKAGYNISHKQKRVLVNIFGQPR